MPVMPALTAVGSGVDANGNVVTVRQGSLLGQLNLSWNLFETIMAEYLAQANQPPKPQ